jgi:hypothetical protein
MAKSLVRVSKKARNIDTLEYKVAVDEFVKKMGGANKIISVLQNKYSIPMSKARVISSRSIDDQPAYMSW